LTSLTRLKINPPADKLDRGRGKDNIRLVIATRFSMHGSLGYLV